MSERSVENPTFSSKRDTWIEVLAWLGMFGMIVAAVVSWRSPEPLLLRAVLLGASVGLVALLLSVLYGTHYTLMDDALLVRSGPFHWRIALDAIETIAPTRNPLSSPAPSLDRLEIRCRNSPHRLLISPRDKIGLLEGVAALSRGLVVEGDRVRRTWG